MVLITVSVLFCFILAVTLYPAVCRLAEDALHTAPHACSYNCPIIILRCCRCCSISHHSRLHGHVEGSVKTSGLRMIAELQSCEYYTILAPPLLPPPVILDLMWIPGHHSILLYLLSPRRTRSDLLLLFAAVLDWSCAFVFIYNAAFDCGIIYTIVCFINSCVIGESTICLGHLVSTLIYVKITIANLNEVWSEVPAAVTVETTGFWDVMPYSLVDMYRCVRRTCCR